MHIASVISSALEADGWVKFAEGSLGYYYRRGDEGLLVRWDGQVEILVEKSVDPETVPPITSLEDLKRVLAEEVKSDAHS